MAMKRTWTDAEISNLLAMDEDEFLAAYPDRTATAVRLKVGELVQDETYTNFRVRQAMERAQEHERRVSTARAPGMPEELPQDPEALERMFAAMVDLHEASTLVGDKPTKRLEFCPPETRPIGIAFIGDIHCGAHIDYRRFEEDVRVIADTDGLYGVLMGDTVENTKPQSKSGTALYAAVMPNPGTQLAYAATRLRWARGKWLALLQGNHDAWDGRWAGIDRLPALANDLGAEYFTEAGGSIFVTLGGARYHIVARHNSRGNSQINKGNAMRRLWDEWPWAWENADVVVLAHTHEPHLEEPIRKGEPVTYMRTGTYKVNDLWAEANGWRSGYGVGLVVLSPGERQIMAFHPAKFRQGVEYLKMVRDRVKVA